MSKRKIGIGVIIILAVLLFAINYSDTKTQVVSEEKKEEKEEKDTFWGLTREQFNYSFVVPEEQEIIKIADGLLNGELVATHTIESQPYDINDIDWNMTFSDSPNTFQLYLQSLTSIVYLTMGYELTGEIEYLDLSKKFIQEWDEYRLSDLADNNTFVWYDHGTALRANHIIYFVLAAENGEENYFSEEEETWINGLIKEHGEFLANNDNYTANHNHGIFQDQTLLYCAYFLNLEDKNDWVEIAKQRLQQQLDYAFTDEMVHVENSPGYQLGVMELFIRISEFLAQFQDKFGTTLYDDMKESAEFLAYISKPNGVIAEIGDTSKSGSEALVNSPKMLMFNNEHLLYANSLGKKGSMPKETSVVYPESGYYISRNDWGPDNIEQSTWMMFKSGYSSRTHKHADDNSFMLYSKGKDIFVDPGWYSYVTGNRYRDYFVSSHAHNTVIVDNKTYSPTAENSNKVGIYQYSQNENYDYVLGFNEMYNDVFWDRHFYNIGDAVIIYDNIQSDSEHTYSQLFHASESMKVVNSSKDETLFELDGIDGTYYVRVSQLGKNGENTVIHGDKDKEQFGYISDELHHLETIDTLKYDVKGKNVDIVTVITIENEEGIVEEIKDIEFDNNSFSITKSSNEKFEIALQPRERLHADNVVINKNDNHTFSFSNLAGEGSEATYAWYVIDKVTATPVFKTEYRTTADFQYTFENEGNYLIKAYIQDKNGRYRTGRIVAEIGYDKNNDSYQIIQGTENDLNLVYLGHEYKKGENNAYNFKVNFSYSWNYRILWYIYKDGSYYTNFVTENVSDMDYEFKEPGNYTVMYYLKTPNGDNEYWNFEEITIE